MAQSIAIHRSQLRCWFLAQLDSMYQPYFSLLQAVHPRNNLADFGGPFPERFPVLSQRLCRDALCASALTFDGRKELLCSLPCFGPANADSGERCSAIFALPSRIVWGRLDFASGINDFYLVLTGDAWPLRIESMMSVALCARRHGIQLCCPGQFLRLRYRYSCTLVQHSAPRAENVIFIFGRSC
jgi:hypothetical protein